jgi:hypothetical protein
MPITHGENGRSSVGRTRDVASPTSLAGQFERPHGQIGRERGGPGASDEAKEPWVPASAGTTK